MRICFQHLLSNSTCAGMLRLHDARLVRYAASEGRVELGGAVQVDPMRL